MLSEKTNVFLKFNFKMGIFIFVVLNCLVNCGAESIINEDNENKTIILDQEIRTENHDKGTNKELELQKQLNESVSNNSSEYQKQSDPEILTAELESKNNNNITNKVNITKESESQVSETKNKTKTWTKYQFENKTKIYSAKRTGLLNFVVDNLITAIAKPKSVKSSKTRNSEESTPFVYKFKDRTLRRSAGLNNYIAIEEGLQVPVSKNNRKSNVENGLSLMAANDHGFFDL